MGEVASLGVYGIISDFELRQIKDIYRHRGRNRNDEICADRKGYGKGRGAD